MPSKPNKRHPQQQTPGPTKQELEAIHIYLSQKPAFDKLIAELHEDQRPSISEKKDEEKYDRKIKEGVNEIIGQQRQNLRVTKSAQATMPVLPKEEETGGNLTDQVAKESKDSTASTHQLHGDTKKATIHDHKANPGPVMAENLGQQPVASKEELKKRAEELNK